MLSKTHGDFKRKDNTVGRNPPVYIPALGRKLNCRWAFYHCCKRTTLTFVMPGTTVRGARYCPSPAFADSAMEILPFHTPPFFANFAPASQPASRSLRLPCTCNQVKRNHSQYPTNHPSVFYIYYSSFDILLVPCCFRCFK